MRGLVRRGSLVLSAVSLVVVAISTGCSSAAESRAAANPEPGLKVCTTGDYKPLTYYDPATKQYSGIDIDMARNLASYLGRKVTFVPTTWTTMMKDLATPGKCDIVMGGVSITPQRESQAVFTKPYLSNGKTPLTTAADAGRFQTIAQINQKGVRVIEDAGGTNEAFVKQYLPNTTVTISQSNTAVFGQLLAGKADVMITDAIEAEYQAKQHPGLVAVHPGKPFTSDQKAYMLPKGSPLTAKVNRWLTAALANGTFKRFYNQWMS